MSATQPVKQTFFFDNEPVTKDNLEILELYAKKSGINLNSASEQMFRVSPECLTKGQYSELFKMLFEAAIAKRQPQHAHRCFQCGGSIACSKPDCGETEGECRNCHEGIFYDGKYFWRGNWELMG
jgi:hypothetical protein